MYQFFNPTIKILNSTKEPNSVLDNFTNLNTLWVSCKFYLTYIMSHPYTKCWENVHSFMTQLIVQIKHKVINVHGIYEYLENNLLSINCSLCSFFYVEIKNKNKKLNLNEHNFIFYKI